MPGRNHALLANQIPVAASLYRAGMSRRAVARHFGVSDMAIRSAMKLAGQPMRERVAALRLAKSLNPEKHLPTPPRGRLFYMKEE
jgi:transposase-like protein